MTGWAVDGPMAAELAWRGIPTAHTARQLTREVGVSIPHEGSHSGAGESQSGDRFRGRSGRVSRQTQRSTRNRIESSRPQLGPSEAQRRRQSSLMFAGSLAKTLVSAGPPSLNIKRRRLQPLTPRSSTLSVNARHSSARVQVNDCGGIDGWVAAEASGPSIS